MIPAMLQSTLDAKQQGTVVHPRAKFYLYSRWQNESDSALVLDDPGVKRIDISHLVQSASLSLAIDGQASSLNVTVNAADIPVQVFYNCLIKVSEGYEGLEEDEYVPTFVGVHMGQPGAQGSAAPDFGHTPEAMRTARESANTIQVTFQSREAMYRDIAVTTQGAWRPQATPDNTKYIPFRYYEDGALTGDLTTDLESFRTYDDIGTIVKEVAINDIWGLGLRPEEVAIGAVGYRIQKKLQLVSTPIWKGIQDVLYTMHLIPWFNGSGQLTAREFSIDKSPVRVYSDGKLVVSIDQSSATLEDVNVVIATGLDDETTEVKYDRQRMARFDGTLGFFTFKLKLRHLWAEDSSETFRVRNPKIRGFKANGLLGSLGAKHSIKVITPFEAEITIDMTASKLLQLLGLAVLFTVFSISGGFGNGLATAIFLMIIMLIISEMGHYQFEVWGEPYEIVYRELKAEARLSHFGVEAEGLRRFAYEERRHTVDNKIFSALNNEELADGTVNRGLREFAREELKLRLARSARRSLQTQIDVLLEPGDIVEDHVGYRYFILGITRELGRNSDGKQTMEAFRVR